ncbi:MAG: ceramide glucosyltransferase [Myxococcaceae bacterium]|nr:ceramide glucosyltransferase [Myxococcaceae bacterium]
MSLASGFFVALGCALSLLVIYGHWELSRSIGPRPIPPPRRLKYPSLTVIRPVRGLDPGCHENTLALLDQHYPGALQTLFVFDSELDPAWPVVKEAVRQAEGIHDAQVLISGAPPATRTGKLNAMIYGLGFARGELVAFSDSDTRPAPDLVRLLVEELLVDPEAGDTFAPVVMNGEARTAGDAGQALLLNGWYGTSAARAAAPTGSLPFIMGELVVFTRRALDAIGGLRVAEGQLVDDMYLGACVTLAGLKNVMVPWKLRVIGGAISFREFVKVFRRWLIFSQSGLPLSFVGVSWLRGLTSALALVGTVAALALAPWTALFPLAAAGLLVWSDLRLQERFSGQPLPRRHLWIAAVLPFIGLGLMVSSKINRQVEWRGRSYPLGAGARLAVEKARGRIDTSRFAPR